MAEPAYVRIAGELARRIRAGELPPGTQLRSLDDLAKMNKVSRIVARQAIELLVGQGLVRTIRRKGAFVVDEPNLVRVSPERQFEDPEVTYQNETTEEVLVDREARAIAADAQLSEALGVDVGAPIVHVVTKASVGDRPVSISDSYQPEGVGGTDSAAFLEETVSDALPVPTHAEWLGLSSAELVKSVYQRFLTSDEQVIMVSSISYPRDRYSALRFRMALDPR
ncbi:GntR family transcriptional regulator [Nocardia neocaledoniensis]|uniref:GntR family transcriptional regulator n=1 Tax=Nocardia neocaledoniensis TaxID=236511 RepID=UPI002453D179|nr:GntR family transcriptional regulator [Nocardia neocaledoniensis]